MKPVKRFEFGEMLTADRFNEMVDAINLLIGPQGIGDMTPEQENHFSTYVSKWSIPPVRGYVRDLKTGEPYPDDMSPAAEHRRTMLKADTIFPEQPKQDDEWNNISSSLGF